jgi:glycosyltransferase involved in cell wall biosynthesis
VQLREASNGETSAAIARCLAAGVPTIVTAIGSAAELPDDCVVKVPRDVSADDLGDEIAALLADASRREHLGRAAIAYAREHSFERVAEVLYENVIRPVGAPLRVPGAARDAFSRSARFLASATASSS